MKKENIYKTLFFKNLVECVVIVLISVNDTKLNKIYEFLKKRNKILSELDKFENSSENNKFNSDNAKEMKYTNTD